jgi:hypothetical protein
MGLSLQRLLRYAYEGEDMLHRIVTGDESRARYYQANQSVLQCSEKIPIHLHPKSLSLRLQLGKLCLSCSGILREYC